MRNKKNKTKMGTSRDECVLCLEQGTTTILKHPEGCTQALFNCDNPECKQHKEVDKMAKFQCEIEALIIEAENEEEAYAKAEKIVKKAGLMVHSVEEVV